MRWLFFTAVIITIGALLSFAVGRTFADAFPFISVAVPLFIILGWVAHKKR